MRATKSMTNMKGRINNMESFRKAVLFFFYFPVNQKYITFISVLFLSFLVSEC